MMVVAMLVVCVDSEGADPVIGMFPGPVIGMSPA
jgi:hypothetical protein